WGMAPRAAGGAPGAACGGRAPQRGAPNRPNRGSPAAPAAGGGAVSGAFTVWQGAPELPLDIKYYDEFFSTFEKDNPSIKMTKEFIGYGDMLDKTRVAVRGGGGPNVAMMPILWGVEFAANKFLRPLKPQDLGYTNDTFWPKALNSCKWEGESYGVPTNNECMAMIINKELFSKVKADPDKGPQTWQEVVEISKKMKMDLGISGLGMVARLNHGNTPFRFMPLVWAQGGSVLDESEDNPTMKNIRVNSPETRSALEMYRKMYVDDKSVPQGALDNTQAENQELFINEKIAMMISHPTEFAAISAKKPEIAAKMNYVLIPMGTKRRAAVYGGSNIHIFKNTPDAAMPAVLHYIKTRTNPEWSNKLNWLSSNPGNRDGFKHPLFEQRKNEIKFLNVTTEMLNHGIPFPVIPEATDIMNLIVPTMIHNALTGKMTVEAATDDAHKKITELFARRK
ncbi:MAG: sugar ABC transporter substrate-binding protein, partial [Anaerolineae bacterium]|nr:sugar ABC transporter substrate-binding protein [Anaerolineae bacterium]